MVLDNIMKILLCVSLLVGAVECFAGFKTMKAMLAIWGFFIGAALGVVVGVISGSVAPGVIFVILLGTGLAILAYNFYLAGVFMVMALFITAAVYIMCEDFLISLTFAVSVGIISLFFVKPAVIVSTSFSGAGIILSSAYLMMSQRLNANPVITGVLWMFIACAGVACQFITTKNMKPETNGLISPARSENPSIILTERRYPGMQKAYRNFCIKCGCKLLDTSERCPQCGFGFND
ncbi:MAG: hypothetical protein J1F64_06925 [Oscillospiraceae bacterium]|nr:hypothetical protein [Oscillospiraceae bacterium]